MPSAPITVFLETGSKRTFAGATEWPGWCRSGRDEASALAALFAYGPRYAAAIRSAGLGFQAPAGVEDLNVIERVQGNATTDFGAPDAALTTDSEPFDKDAVRRCSAVLRAVWKAFDDAVELATGVELTKGPRGGGRNLNKIIEHAWGSELSYVSLLGWKVRVADGTEPTAALAQTRQSMLDALAAGASGELPQQGPRGGKLWLPRRAVRRAAWHMLDHAWEIEDRAKGGEGGI